MTHEQLDLFDMTFNPKPVEQKVKETKVLAIKKQTMKIIKAAEDIEMSPVVDQIDFLHSILCQVGMPRSETKELRFERRNGQAGILLEAGDLWHPDGHFEKQPLPSGTRPRLIMIHITSEAVKKKNKVIDLKDSPHEFLNALGIAPTGSNYNSTRRQINALAACRMTLGMGYITYKACPIEKFTAWVTKDKDQVAMWPGEIELSDKFFNTMVAHAVPLDRRALAVLKNSSLKLDIYTWLAQRLCRIESKKGLELSWDRLKNQFGEEYSRENDFKREFERSLKAVLTVYPKAKVSSVLNGLILLPSAPPVQKTQMLIS